MMRWLTTSVLTAAVVFGWGMVYWVATPMPWLAIENMPQSQALTSAFQQHLPASGAYWFPPAPQGSDDLETSKAEMAAFAAAHEAGPVGVLFYRAEGFPMMGGRTIAQGALIALASAMLAVGMLMLARQPSYGRRVLFVFGMGVFAALVSHVKEMNWMLFNPAYAWVASLDTVVGWLLGGLLASAMIRPVRSHAGGVPEKRAKTRREKLSEAAEKSEGKSEAKADLKAEAKSESKPEGKPEAKPEPSPAAAKGGAERSDKHEKHEKPDPSRAARDALRDKRSAKAARRER